jgi:four helix bundle protein
MTPAGGSPSSEDGRRKYDLQERLLRFTCLIVDAVESMSPSRAGGHVAGQLIRCGTSPVANYAEAQSAESRRDFVHKAKVVLKELRETIVWLEVTRRRSLSSRPALVAEGLQECGELVAIFRASIATAERNMRKRVAPP